MATERFEDVLRFLGHVDEFPRECVEWLTATVRSGGLAALRLRKFEAVAHILTIVAWAVGRLKDHPAPDPNRPDDGVIIGDDQTEMIVNECVRALQAATECEAQKVPAEFVGGAWLTRQLINMAIAYLVGILSDSDKVEDVLAEVLAWIQSKIDA